MRWFEQLFGFEERKWESTQALFSLEGTELVSLVNGRRFEVGRFSTPSLAELRIRSAAIGAGTLHVTHEVIGDVLELHGSRDNATAMFQVASQFNCLEFAGPEELPEDGVTQYDDDPTQGPACSIAAGAATVVRNYFIEVRGERGQRRDRQLNNLEGVLHALGAAGTCVEVRNGYTFSDAERLRILGDALARHDRDALMGALRIGIQSGVGVTFERRGVETKHPARVSQAFCSALSCGYTGGPKELWAPIATVVLDAAYEAVLRATLIEKEEGRGSGKVWLTLLGGGAFGNERRWIGEAIAKALARLRGHALDVHVAHYRKIDEEIRAIVDATVAGTA